MKKQRTIHMTGHAHIDPVWLWRWDEGLQVVISTFQAVLNLMKKFPEFIFISSSAVFYKWVEENEPEMFAEIKKRVKEGKWQIVGGWWVEPDCNIPSGESFIRHSLYGQRYFLEKFGRTTTVGFNPDSFGHNWSLPQILKKSGIDYYVFMRPGAHEKELPANLFWWQAQDGSKVLTYRIPFSYSTGTMAEHVVERIEKLKSYIEQLTSNHEFQDFLCFYGVGDHGGGPSEENIKAIKRLSNPPYIPPLSKGEKGGFWKIKFSSPEEFFKRISSVIPSPASAGVNLSLRQRGAGIYPIIIDDLQYHSKGCYSAHSEVKRLNKEAENSLITAEKFASIANSITGLNYPDNDIKKAWQNALFSQFHDIMAGTSSIESYNDVRNILGESLSIAARTLHYAIGKIARRIDTKRKGKRQKVKGKNENEKEDEVTPVIIFNPSSYRKIAPIEVEYGFGKDNIDFISYDGKKVNTQRIQSSVTVGEGKKRFVLIADIPSLGYKTYMAKRTQSSPLRASSKRSERTKSVNIIQTYKTTTIENEYFSVEIDSKTGHILSIIDTKLNFNILKDKGAAPVVINDPSDTWSHGIEEFREEIGYFSDAKISLLEIGSVRIRLRIENKFNNSTLRQDIVLYKSFPFIEFRCLCDWHENLKMLKISFPLNLKSAQVYAGIPFGYIKRNNDGKEFAAQNWINVSGKIPMSSPSPDENNPHTHTFTKGGIKGGLYGVALITDSKYSFDVLDSDMRLTVLRSPVYAHHNPTKLNPEEHYQYQDQGIQEFTYRLFPYRTIHPISKSKIQNFMVSEVEPPKSKKNSKLQITNSKQTLNPNTTGTVSTPDNNAQFLEVIKTAEDLHQPLIYTIESPHIGVLPQSQSFISIDNPLPNKGSSEILISAVKMAEDKDGIIIRAYETAGQKVKAKINIPFLKRKFTANFSPHEIKTFNIPYKQNKPIKEVNLIEIP